MALPKKHTSIIHVAKAQLGLTDDDYRAILQSVAGVDSSTKLTGAGFDAVMHRFHQLGFKSTHNRRNFGTRPGMASPGQVSMISGLWAEFTGGQGTDITLGKWLRRQFGVEALRFLPADSAHRAIGALKTMNARKEGQHQRD